MIQSAVIGTGAAGISAALTLKALGREFRLFGKAELSDKIQKAECIRNYPGLVRVSGDEMARTFQHQLRDMDIAVTDKQVTGVYSMGDRFAVLCDRETFEVKTVILCTGVESVKPLSGEVDFLGRGVSYCATCDGFLYKGKTIAVVCTTKSLEHEIAYLASLAEKVFLVPLYPNVSVSADNLEIVKGMPTAIVGDRRVRALAFGERQLPVDGVFMLKSAVAPAVLVPGLRTEAGHVVVDRDMKTNLVGCFAAGDCTGRPYQYAKAVGEGNVAAHAVNEYLSAQRERNRVEKET